MPTDTAALKSTLRQAIAQAEAQLAALEVRYNVKYTDDQPRDESGRWSSGGGSSGGGDDSGGSGGSESGDGSGFRKLDDRADADEFGREVSQGVYDSASESEISAISDYKGDGYEEINSGLRDPSGGGENETTQALDSLISKSTLPSDTVVYRGFDSSILDEEDMTDSVINDKGYVSTTLLSKSASRYGDGIMEIRLPKGTPAFFADLVPGTRRESEFVLSRDSSFRIISDNYSDDPSQRKLVLEIVK